MAAREVCTELRLDAPNELVTILDGISLAQRITRNQLVLRVLHEWADARVHEASVLARLTGINPAHAESSGKDSEGSGRASA